MEKFLIANVLIDMTMNKDGKLTEEYLLLDRNSCSYSDMEMENKIERYVSYYTLAQLDVSKRFLKKNIVFSHADFDDADLATFVQFNAF